MGMNIKVQKAAPGIREGAEGELRLVVTSRGAFLYIKGDTQWFSLRVTPTLTAGTDARRKRAALQGDTLTIASDEDGDVDTNHDGSILPGNGRRNQPDRGAPPDAPH